jgi:hypothetical protein
MGLLEDFNTKMEDAQAALRNALTAHGETLSAAFQLYFDNCQKEQETFKTKTLALHAHLHSSLHGTEQDTPSIETEVSQTVTQQYTLRSALNDAISYLNEKKEEDSQ